MTALVQRDAARVAATLRLPEIFPARRAIGVLALTAGLWLVALVRTTSAAPLGPAASATAMIDGVDVTVIAPAYARRAPRTLRNPASIDALAGSRLVLTVRTNAARIALDAVQSTEDEPQTTSLPDLATIASGARTAELVATGNGYFALVPSSADGIVGARRLIGLMVTPDLSPLVAITAPGRDLLLPDGSQTLSLTVAAHDDIALGSLRLRYTRLSGSGERFAFTEGEITATVARTSDTAWTAHATWNLAPLKLDAGDMVVYRALATDTRPGARPVESDAFIAEIAAPGGVAAGGFALDPEQERYALSQQMVILKSERLLARRAATAADAFANDAADIALEQRRVRAEFVFMMGGEMGEGAVDEANLADLNEEAEAAGEDDLAAGRMANAGRTALLRAIRAMSRAARALNAVDVPAALTSERAALTQLERAFAHNRILLRPLSERERLDLTRRLTGDMSGASRYARVANAPRVDVRVAALSVALADAATLASRPRAADVTALADRVLRVDPASKPLQEIAQQLSSSAALSARGRTAEARDLLDRATSGLARALRSGLPLGSGTPRSLERSTLDGALGDALKRGGAPQ